MIQKLTISPHQISDHACITINSQGSLSGFPFLSIDRDSYLVGVEVQSGIDFDVAGGRHCIAIGKGCSLAESITFMIDLNHDYASVCQGELSFLPKSPSCGRAPRKGSIILQNDVWIGHGATIMAGVTLHNGCVVAADAVITKDVPPYAIVGGNPAKILRCRFDKDTIDSLQKIAWWDWPLKTQQLRRDDFLLPAPEFAAKYLPEAEARLRKSQTVPPRTLAEETVRTQETVLVIPDFSDAYPLYPKIFEQYFSKDRPNLTLLIYLSAEDSTPGNLDAIQQILQRHEACDCDVILQTGETLEEYALFQCADYFVTTRGRRTVSRTCLADLCHTKILYGTDNPIFSDRSERIIEARD